jgi:16S rRNA (uracil1498-N3)-methyltransferase
MPPRFHLAVPLQTGQHLTLPEGPSRHAQVLRLQPSDSVTLFNGEGGEWQAEIRQMGRKEVQVVVGAHVADDTRELPRHVTLAIGMPANERMDHLVEKATELGVAAVQPLMCERSVLRLSGERALRKQLHWQAVVVSACEQSGRTRVPVVAPVLSLTSWLGTLKATAPEAGGACRVVLSTGDAPPLPQAVAAAKASRCVVLSGPEGGLSPAEESAAVAAGFIPASLGARVLRADTAPLAALAWWSLGGA